MGNTIQNFTDTVIEYAERAYSITVTLASTGWMLLKNEGVFYLTKCAGMLVLIGVYCGTMFVRVWEYGSIFVK